MKMSKRTGFTLIELLIVVAIIAILAAIAVPNFLEAQTRAKISKVKAEFRTVGTALEAYAVDWQKYPHSYAFGETFGSQWLEWALHPLTSPIAYLTTVSYRDPFGQNIMTSTAGKVRSIYMYVNHERISNQEGSGEWADNCRILGLPTFRSWFMWSCGPNRTDDWLHWGGFYPEEYAASTGFTKNYASYPFHNSIYDSTNGTVSYGDIVRAGGDLHGFKNLPVDK